MQAQQPMEGEDSRVEDDNTDSHILASSCLQSSIERSPSKNVELASCEAHVTILAQPDTPPRSNSATRHDNGKSQQEGMPSNGTCENESSKPECMVDCVSEGSIPLAEKCDHTSKVLREMSGHCDPRVKNINEITTEQTQSTTLMTDSLPCDASTNEGDNIEAGDLQEPKESIISVMDEGAINDQVSLPEVVEDAKENLPSFSSNTDIKRDASFTFEVVATAGLEPTIQVGAKGNSERKTRRKSAGKETVKVKETTPRQSGMVEKSSALLTPPATGHVIHVEELNPKEKVEGSITKLNVPDLNNATSIFQQPFTDNQQVELRAQILVYGSLISGTSPEEPHMVAAFGQSDTGRKAWEVAWRACVERFHGQKSQANTPGIPVQPQSDLKDVGHITPDSVMKHSSLPSNVLSSPIAGVSYNTPPALSPMIPLASPLWNMSTPSSVGFPTSGMPRNAILEYRKSFSPLNPYQTPPTHNLSGCNPQWLSQSSFPGQWLASSSVSAFDPAPRFSTLPITEAVKLIPVNVSGGPGIKHTYPIPVVHSTSDAKKTTLSSAQFPSDSKSRKRKKVTGVTALPIANLPQVPCIVGQNHIPILGNRQTNSVTAPVVSSIFSTAVTVSTPASITSDSSPDKCLSVSLTHDHRKFGDNKAEDAAIATKTWQPSVDQTSVVPRQPVLSLLSENQTNSMTDPAFSTPVAMSTPVSVISKNSPSRFYSTPSYPKMGHQNIENDIAPEETRSDVKESKLQAENAALLAAAEVGNCGDVWSSMERQRSSGVVSDDEAKLMSSVVSIAAATSVAKMAAAAAKIASDVAEQARLMADEVFLSSKTENFDQSGILYHPNVVNKATPAFVLKGVDKTNHPNPIISAARVAARRRIEAASTASKHAENLDAIIKAAELAAEAVSQVGKIVAMGNSSSLKKLAEAGPEGYWKISHQGEAAPNLLTEETQNLKPGPVHLADNQMTVIDSSITGNERGKRIPRAPKVPKLSKAVNLATETDTGPQRNYVVNIPQRIPGIWEEHNITEGCLVEVYKEDGKYKGSWLAANVSSLKDETALVCYTEIQCSEDDSGKLMEWVALEVEAPRIRIAHPMTTMRFEGTRKRPRTAVTDYAWSNGDRVDVWMQDCWREGVVTEPNKTDTTSLAVNFPVHGETSFVRSWNVRPTLIWKDRKWIEWSSLKGGRASEGETPKEKRMKLGSPADEDKGEEKFPDNIGVVELRRKELPLSAQERSFTVGKSTTRDDDKLRTMRSGLPKEGARVVFGVPKPGKKQKFMEVSKHYVADGNNKNNTRYLKPRGWNNNSKNDALDVETKSRLNSRKPPVPSFRTLTHKDNNLISCKSTTRDSEMTDRSDGESIENLSSHRNKKEVGSSSNKRNGAKDLALNAPKRGFTFTSKPRSEHPFNKGKLAPAAADVKTPKVEVKDKFNPEVNETRRSNRKIQPTSRLLEGLQSSFSISKPSVSPASQRNNNKVTWKGNIKSRMTGSS